LFYSEDLERAIATLHDVDSSQMTEEQHWAKGEEA